MTSEGHEDAMTHAAAAHPVAAPLVKPLLRGWSHLVAFFLAVIATAVLVIASPPGRHTWSALVYGLTLCTLFGVSAAYHRPNWRPNARQWMRRLDHSAIFLLIAGTFTPFAVGMPEQSARLLLLVGWGGALIGILRALFWIRAPKPFVAITYLALGWAPVWFGHELTAALGTFGLVWVAIGGALYSLGALAYAFKRPNPWPRVFGYHEIFHALVILAAGCHYVAVAHLLIRG